MLQATIKQLMKLREREITFHPEDGAIYQELFDHPSYAELDEDSRMELGLQWARRLYQDEVDHPLFDIRFPGVDLSRRLEGAVMLDMGCYVGGKTVRWLERYQGAEIHGIDVDPRFVRVATAFANEKGANAHFKVNFAEELDFPDAFFDAIFSENTFEHVRDIRSVFRECHRVLKPGGVMAVIFPSFRGPVSHHLNLVTTTPFLHWIFSYPALLRAYFAILDERGDRATWYRRQDERPLPFERGYSINGTGAMEFRRLLGNDWDVLCDGYRQRTQGKNAVKNAIGACMKGSRLPFFRELFGIAYVLQKR